MRGRSHDGTGFPSLLFWLAGIKWKTCVTEGINGEKQQVDKNFPYGIFILCVELKHVRCEYLTNNWNNVVQNEIATVYTLKDVFWHVKLET